MYADQIRRAAEAAPRVELPKVAERLWRAYGAGLVTEAEATGLSELIEALKAVPASPPPARKHVGSRPRTDASTARRRRWAASGWLPPTLATRFTAAELAALAVVAAEVAQRGDCRMPIERIAAVGGVSRTTVKNAIRQARLLGFLTVEERRRTAFRSDTNVIRITGPEWISWLRLAPQGRPPGGGVRSVTTTSIRYQNVVNDEPASDRAGDRWRHRGRWRRPSP